MSPIRLRYVTVTQTQSLPLLSNYYTLDRSKLHSRPHTLYDLCLDGSEFDNKIASGMCCCLCYALRYLLVRRTLLSSVSGACVLS
jgi:hypothetical protein